MVTDQRLGGNGCRIILIWLLFAIAAAAAILFVPGCAWPERNRGARIHHHHVYHGHHGGYR